MLAIAVALVLFAASAFNTPLARMEREITRILAEHGFEGNVYNYGDYVSENHRHYRAEDRSEADFEKILDALESDCKGCTVRISTGVSASRRLKTITITASDSLAPLNYVVIELSNDFPKSMEYQRPYIDLTVDRDAPTTFADKVRSWFP